MKHPSANLATGRWRQIILWNSFWMADLTWLLPTSAAVAREPVQSGEVVEQTVAEMETTLGLPTSWDTSPQVCRAEETRAVGQVPRSLLAPLLDSQTESAWEVPQGSPGPVCQQSSFAELLCIDFGHLIRLSLLFTGKSAVHFFSVLPQRGPGTKPVIMQAHEYFFISHGDFSSKQVFPGLV